MLMQKLKVVAVAVLATAALGAVGLAGRTGDQARAQDASTPAARTGGRPAGELEALRRENEDLRATLRVLLKEIQTLQRGADAGPRKSGPGGRPGGQPSYGNPNGQPGEKSPADTGRPNDAYRRYSTDTFMPGTRPTTGSGYVPGDRYRDAGSPPATTPKPGAPEAGGQTPPHDPNLTGLTREVEDALRALHRAGDPESRRRAAEALDRATRRIREQYVPAGGKRTS